MAARSGADADRETTDGQVRPTGLRIHRDRRTWMVATAVLAPAGALWGAVAYAILWGYTSIVVTRQFVNSPQGLVALLPVRIVLYAIKVVEEDVVGHSFNFSRNHAWIGAVSAVVGGLLVAGAFLLLRAAVRPLRRIR